MNRKQRRAAEKARRSPAYPPKPGANAASDAPHATIAGVDSNGRTIGLCMIVKNESEVILRCLESVRPIVDYVLIEDTGSTDGTQAIIREWLDRTGLPGEVYDKPWQDFAYNRSHALARLRENKGVDYAFMIDADDQLVVEAGFDAAMFKQSLSKDLYKVPLRQGLVHYLVNQICSNKVEFRYRGVLHEFIEGPEGFSSGTAAGFYILSGREGARSKDPDKYRKDARVLEQALQAEQDAFLRSRYTFYLARSYRDAGEKEKALDNYLKRAKLGYWTEEVFESLYGAAELLKAMGRPLDEVIAMYLRASDAVPSRAEALHAASRLCRENSKFADGFEYARRGLKIPQPAAGLFVQSWVYDYGLLDEFAINAYWTGRYAESADACDRLLNEGKLPAEMRDRVEKNKDFAVSKQQEIAASSSPEPDAFLKLLGAAREKEKLGRPNEEVITTYVDATAACPTRAEALHGAARFCRNKGLHERGYEFAAQGLTIAYPNNAPAVEDWIYEYGLLDELAVNAYWTAKYAECTDACDRLLSEGKLPTEKRDRVLKNKQFAIDKLAEKNAPRSITLRPTWVPEAPAAGTELMVAGLRERIGTELERINLQVNHPGHDKTDKRPRVVWMHHHVNQRWVQWCKDKELVDSVTCFVFVSYWQREQYLNAFGLPPQRCVVLRHALTVSPDLRRWEAGSKWRCAYTSTPFRGLSVLLDAWERLSPANAELHIWSSMKLYLEDDGPYRHLYERAESMPGVIYHGVAPNRELRAALQSMHFLVYPCTFEETACLAVIEAMAAGCRVIVPSLGALPETTGGYARVYPNVSDPKAHAKAFADILADEMANPWGGETELSATQQRHCAAVYDWHRRIREWEKLIDTLSAPNQMSNPVSPTGVISTIDGTCPRVFGMVATRNTKFLTEKALASFFKTTNFRAVDQFLLFENDQNAAIFDKSFPIEIIRNHEPRSFAQNVNHAIDIAIAANSDLIFLNNDVIFTHGWLQPLLEINDAISIPLCNQQLQYKVDGLNLSFAMDWEEFGGHFELLEEIAKQNSAKHTDEERGWKLLMPFYCFRAPLKILTDVGRFDETFGAAGGEDVDYRLRTLLAGYDVVYAKRSFLLHFMGKSTWRAGEAAAKTETRNNHYRAAFQRKWGQRAANLFLAGGTSSSTARESQISELISSQEYRKLLNVCLFLDKPEILTQQCGGENALSGASKRA
jgi:glycosyltransferase involved in cell wall biosynthesis/GT2 family glycosyltransferase